jgi:hypothetical protein
MINETGFADTDDTDHAVATLVGTTSLVLNNILKRIALRYHCRFLDQMPEPVDGQKL